MSPEDEARGALFLLMRNPTESRRWLARCVERVTFEDYSTIRRDIWVDLRLGAMTSPAPELDGCILIPVARLPIGQHTTFAAFDEHGSELARLTKQEERDIVIAGLFAHAKDVLSSPTGDSIELTDDTKSAIRAIAYHRDEPETLDQSTQGRSLLANDKWRIAIDEAYKKFYLVVALPKGRKRRVLRLRYYEQALRTDKDQGTTIHGAKREDAKRLALAGVSLPQNKRSLAVELVERLIGARGTSFKIDVGSKMAECESYHFEIVAPFDLRVVGACLYYEDQQAGKLIKDDDTSTATAHVHASNIMAVNSAQVYARLVPVATGVLRTSWTSATFIFLVLLLGALVAQYQPSIFGEIDPSSAAAVLLLAPAVLAAALARRSPHSLTTTLMFQTRLSVILCCACLFAVAVSVSVGVSDVTHLRWIWWSAAGTCLVILVRLLAMRVRVMSLVKADAA